MLLGLALQHVCSCVCNHLLALVAEVQGWWSPTGSPVCHGRLQAVAQGGILTGAQLSPSTLSHCRVASRHPAPIDPVQL